MEIKTRLNKKLNMKLNTLFLAVAVGASTLATVGFGPTAHADGYASRDNNYRSQEGRRGGPRGGARMMERMAQELKLSASQKSKIQKIMNESRERGRKIRENTSLSDDQKRSKMRENREATKKRIDAILTSDQKKKLAAMRSRMRNQRRQNGDFRRGDHKFGGPRKPI